MPTTSSIWRSTAGSRLRPASRAGSSAASTVSSVPMVTMSVRGTITSRTTVSPNSMIEWMRARSSVSMTSPSTATSAMASSSDSVTGAPRSRPCSPMKRLARPMRPPETIRTGQKRTRADTTAPSTGRPAPGWWTAQFFGTASANTKITTISKTVAATTPQAPNQRTARMPTRVATTSWQIEHQEQHRVEEPLGVLGEPDQDLGARAGRRRPGSWPWPGPSAPGRSRPGPGAPRRPAGPPR